MIHFGYFSFSAIHLEFICSRGLLENHTRFKTIIDKIYAYQNGSKTIPFGTAHTYILYIGSLPGNTQWQMEKYSVHRKYSLSISVLANQIQGSMFSQQTSWLLGIELHLSEIEKQFRAGYSLGHFRVAVNIIMKARLSAQSLL